MPHSLESGPPRARCFTRQGVMKILMATDGSVHASTAMLTASKLIARKDAEVDVVSVGAELVPAGIGIGSQIQSQHERQVASHTQKTLNNAQRLLSQLH